LSSKIDKFNILPLAQISIDACACKNAYYDYVIIIYREGT
jgi:hypothetical protein